MGTFASYGRLETAIIAADTGSIRQRWEYARRLLVDRSKTTPDGRLKNGVLDGLIAAAARQGIKISRREIQYRIQAGRTYASEAEYAQLVAHHETWKEVIQAGFPAVGLPLDASLEPFDPRTPEERARDAGEAIDLIAGKPGGQLELFGYFKETAADELSTIGELRKYATEMSEWTQRQAKRDRERIAYVNMLSAAVGGDESKTWAEANEALHGNGGPS